MIGRLPFPAARIQFVDSQHGWVTSTWSNAIASTTDGGATWKTFSPAAVIGRGRGLRGMGELVAYSRHAAWVIISDQLLTTNDGSSTWNRHPELEAMTSVTRVSDTVGFALSVNASIYRTEDGGAHWAPVSRRFVGSQHALDGVPKGNTSGFIRFTDPTHGWLVLCNAKEPPDLFFGTDDGGRTWFETNMKGVPSREGAFVYDMQVRGHIGWLIANTLPDKNGVVVRYYVLKLDDGLWVSCGQADTLSSIRLFAGVVPDFVWVRDGKSKLVRYECGTNTAR